MANELNPELLKNSIKNGVRGVQDVLTNGEVVEGQLSQKLDRNVQVERARTAVGFLRAELGGLNTAEKKRVVEASRLVIQDALESVSGEVQQELAGAKAKSKLDTLESTKKDFIAARNEVFKLETELANLREQISIGGREVTNDVKTAVKEKDWKTLAIYAVSVAGAAAATKWIWDHSIGWLWGKAAGSQKKPGFLRKAAAFTVMLAGAAAGAIGLNRFMRGNAPLPGPLKDAGDAVQGAGDTLKEIGTPPLEALLNLFKMIGYPVADIADGKFDTALEDFLKHGGGFFVEAGKTFLVFGAKHIEVGTNIAKYTKSWMFGSEYHGRNIAAVYGAAGVLYVVDSAIVSTMLRGKPGLLSHGLVKGSLMTAGRAVAWPVALLKEGSEYSIAFFTEGSQIFKHKLQGWPLFGARAREVRAGVKLAQTGEVENLIEAMQKYMVLHEARDYMKLRPEELTRFGLGFSPDEINKLEKHLAELAGEIKTNLAAADIAEDAPEYLKRLHTQSTGGTLKMFAESMDSEFGQEARVTSSAADAAGDAGKSTGEAADALSKTRPADTVSKVDAPEARNAPVENTPRPNASEGDLKTAVGADDMSNPQALPEEQIATAPDGKPRLGLLLEDGTRVEAQAAGAAVTGEALDAKTAGKVEDLLTDNKAFAKLLEQSGRSADEVRQILGNVEGLSPDIMARIEMSPKAQQMLAGALEVKGIAGAQAEAQHVINLANRARAWRLGFNGFGAAADVFGIAMAAVDMWENQERIKNTQNPALKEIYNNAYYMYSGQMATNAFGLVYSGVYMIAAAKGGAGLVTALSAPAGAVMLPVAVAAIAARATYKSLEKSAEYHTLTEQDMVRQYTPGKIQQHIAASTSVETMTWTQDFVMPREIALSANHGARWEGYRAYFAQLAPSYIPLGAADGAGQESPEKQKEAIAKEDTERRSFFIGHAIAFIDKRTNGTFDPVKDPQVYEEACLYAQMRFAEKYADATVDASTDSGIATYREKRETETYNYLAELSAQDSDAFAREVGPVLLQQLRHDLALCEMKLLNASFSNLSTSAAWSKWYGDADMRCVARGFMAQEIWNTLHSFTQRKCTAENFKNSVKYLKDFMTKDADSIAVAAIRTPDHKKYFEIGGSPERLTVPGMSDLLNEHQLHKPESLSASAADPLSAENLRFHYEKQIKGQMPVILKLAPGAAEGYLSLRENMWSRMDGSGECKNVSPGGIVTALALRPGLHQFWYHHSMPQKMIASATRGSVARYETVSKPNKRPDFEVIVQESDERLAA